MWAGCPVISSAPMLKTSEKKKLRQGLSANQPENDPANLAGNSYSQLAKEVEVKFGIKATPRSIRHYVYSIRKEDATWSHKPLNKGRPTKTALTPSDMLVKEVSAYLMQLTGFSESGIYRLLRSASDQQWPDMGKVTFHKLFKGPRTAKHVLNIETSDELLSHCCLVLGQTRLNPACDADQCLLLWGIEATTGYFNFWLINLIPSDSAATPKRGRPKKATFSEVALLDHEGNAVLPATVLRDFLADCQRRLCLPLNRAVLPGEYDIALIQAMSPIRMVSGTPPLSLSLDAMSALPDVEALHAQLETASIRHYRRTAKPFVSALRRSIRELVEDYRKKLAKAAWPKYLREAMPEAAALDDFYNRQPKFQARTLFQKHPLIRLRHKNPGEPDKAG